MKLDDTKQRIQKYLTSFLILNPDFSYIQGLDSITIVLYTEFLDSKEFMILPLLKTIYSKYLNPFIEKDTNRLNFQYASLVTTRLTSFFEPELFTHFSNIGF
mmetsp:Transcript_26014/g.18476  ORF Transcript_26014/g.18476 Transcript_26014/m.18476 type:complete len:102 (-) Transcript_26014:937-1242(-)